MHTLRDLLPGSRVTLADGDVYEVVENPQDGMWLLAVNVADRDSTDDPEIVHVFESDIVSIEPVAPSS